MSNFLFLKINLIFFARFSSKKTKGLFIDLFQDLCIMKRMKMTNKENKVINFMDLVSVEKKLLYSQTRLLMVFIKLL
ncbi:hypothetical protein CCS41_14100 (plasmid) [Candidatus Fukatsuia symbiotica]|uniref:Uncharacterized protein n=1 Tax=Candidatus Fukatsuia symbiotica TaxID=1878942 RepID=A0A2U8I8P0_9GAMM|nr:hypothetical protein CCS41_14100 [Candidatus Fukatsuia symbiotica]